MTLLASSSTRVQPHKVALPRMRKPTARPLIRAAGQKPQHEDKKQVGQENKVSKAPETAEPPKANWLRSLGEKVFAWQVKTGLISTVETHGNPPETDSMPPLLPHTRYRIVGADDFGNVALKNDSSNPPIFVRIDDQSGHWNPEVIISIEKLFQGIC